METRLEQLDEKHAKGVMDIFNHYVENSFAAYPETKLPYEMFGMFLSLSKGYPAYAVMNGNDVVGFGMLRAYSPFPAFKDCAEISYFLHPSSAGKGIGSMLFAKLSSDAKLAGIKTILAGISSKNEGSIRFHSGLGFTECGCFRGIGQKFGERFDVIWMQKKVV